jgi:hypothetical protein
LDKGCPGGKANFYHPQDSLPGAKWLITRIDRICRSFLWRGENPDNVKGGHSLINWPTSCLPKEKGGPGILELERFTRALRLRWLWFKWKQKQRAWNQLKIPCDATDRELFYASTTVRIGDGKTAPFWSSNWINGTRPKTLAPLLYEKTRRKKITVHQALTHHKWIDHIYPPTSQEEVTQYVRLWEAVGSNWTIRLKMKLHGDGQRMGNT